MSEDAYRLKSPDGSETELPVRKGSVGPDVIDIARLYRNKAYLPTIRVLFQQAAASRISPSLTVKKAS